MLKWLRKLLGLGKHSWHYFIEVKIAPDIILTMDGQLNSDTREEVILNMTGHIDNLKNLCINGYKEKQGIVGEVQVRYVRLRSFSYLGEVV